jgi:hypothetical protein
LTKRKTGSVEANPEIMPIPLPTVRRVALAALVLGVLLATWLVLQPDRSSGLTWQVIHGLPTGWWHFLRRRIPRMAMDWPALGFAAAATAIAIVLIHRTGKRCCRAWGWRSTLAAFGVPALLFAIALSAGGMATRITELFVSPYRF